jgi:hypothetical protein
VLTVERLAFDRIREMTVDAVDVSSAERLERRTSTS